VWWCAQLSSSTCLPKTRTKKRGERHHHIADNGIARVAAPPAYGRASASLRPEFTCMGIKARCQRNGAKCTSGCVADARYNPKDQWDEHLSARQMRPFIYGRVNSVSQNANANANKWGRALCEPVATLLNWMTGIDVRLCKQTRGFWCDKQRSHDNNIMSTRHHTSPGGRGACGERDTV
jgi:hypothetical protein